MALNVIILAAGEGKRMRSKLPKVLHRLAGKTLLEHVIKTALQYTKTPIVVFGHAGDQVQQTLKDLPVKWVAQEKQLGTAHALQQALPRMDPNQQVLVLYGDVPLISHETINTLLAATPVDALGMLTAHFPDATGLGRILRDDKNHIVGIVEERDANAIERKIKEINSGIYLFPAKLLSDWLPKIKNNNAQKEYYLTDVIAIAVQENLSIVAIQAPEWQEVLGVNDCIQLALLERYYQRSYAKKLMAQGVTLFDPERFDVRGDLTVGQDVIFDVNVIIEGEVSIGNNCTIGPNTIIRNAKIANHVEIKANCIIEDAQIGDDCIIGPFARIRPHTQLQEHVHIGNYVEIKNSNIGRNTKINHLSYIGDSEIGKQVNIGAGTITCNYDGINKHRTIIGDNAFIGSDSQLVAPITIGEGATIGAGSTITTDAPAHQLTLSRVKQFTVKDWQKPKKEEV